MKKLLFTLCIFFNYQSQVSSQITTTAGFGNLRIEEDVTHVKDLVNLFQLSGSMPIYKGMHVKLNIGFAKAFGLDRNVRRINGEDATLIDDVYQNLEGDYFIPNYYTAYAYGNLGLQYGYEIPKLRLYPYVGAGGGLYIKNTSLNLKDNQDEYYDTFALIVSSNPMQTAEDMYDTSYETEYNGDGKSGLLYYYSLGLRFRVNNRLSIVAEWSNQITDTDYLDGVKYLDSSSTESNNDVARVVTVGFSQEF